MEEIKKIYFDRTYTEFVEEEDVEFCYELLAFFYDYNDGIVEDEEEQKLMSDIIKEMEFIRNIPKQIENDIQNIINITYGQLFKDVKEVFETILDETLKTKNNDLLEGLSARIALGLGFRYEDEISEEDNLIQISYDEQADELVITNLLLPE